MATESSDTTTSEAVWASRWAATGTVAAPGCARAPARPWTVPTED